MRGLSGIVFLMSSTVIATQSADANTSVERSQDGISFTITGEIGDSDSGIFEAVRSELNRKSVTVYLNSEGGGRHRCDANWQTDKRGVGNHVCSAPNFML